HEIGRLRAVLRNEAPLHTGREAGATATAQPGVFDHRGDVGRIALHRDPQRLVAATAFVAGAGEAVVLVPELREDGGQRGHRSASCSPDSIAAAPPSGASQPRSWATTRPASEAGPAGGPSTPRPSA